MTSTFVNVQRRGTIALPAEFCHRHGLDQPDAQVEIIEHENGTIELRPHTSVSTDQAWFWTERWQAMEREADAEIIAGRVERFDADADLLAHMDALDG